MTGEKSVFSLYTNDLQAKGDFHALNKIDEIACRINQKYDGEGVGDKVRIHRRLSCLQDIFVDHGSADGIVQNPGSGKSFGRIAVSPV